MVGLTAWVYRGPVRMRSVLATKPDTVFVPLADGWDQGDDPGKPVLYLHRRHGLLGRDEDFPILCPEPEGQTTRCWAFGGTFAHTSDGRWPYGYPLAIHDFNP